MKTIKLIPIMILMISLSLIVSAGISVSNINLNGFIEDNITGTITVTNTGSDNVSNLVLSRTGFTDDTFMKIAALSATTLVPGAQATYQFQITIPVIEATNIKLHSIGTITVNGQNSTSGAVSDSGQVNLEVKPRIHINKVRIDVEGDEETVSEGERIDVRRGDSISLEIEIENDFSRSSNIDTDDVDIEVYNNELDIDEDDQIDIDSGEDETITFHFVIDDNADEGREEVEIIVSGYDDNNVYHEDIFTFYIDVDVPSREVMVKDAYFSPSIITCDRSSTLNIKIKNTGSRDLEDAMVIVESDDNLFSYTEFIKNIDLEEGDTDSLRFNIDFDDDLPNGNYLFDVTTYYGPSTSDDSDTELAYVEIANCAISTTPSTGTSTDTTPTDTSGIDIIQETVTIPTGAVFATTTAKSTGIGSTELIVLLLVNLILIGSILAIIGNMAKNKQ